MKTNSIQIINIDSSIIEMIEIDHENGSFTQMSKSAYETTFPSNSGDSTFKPEK